MQQNRYHTFSWTPLWVPWIHPCCNHHCLLHSTIMGEVGEYLSCNTVRFYSIMSSKKTESVKGTISIFHIPNAIHDVKQKQTKCPCSHYIWTKNYVSHYSIAHCWLQEWRRNRIKLVQGKGRGGGSLSYRGNINRTGMYDCNWFAVIVL